MQQCPNCHATQQQGKFCGKCGTPIVSEMSTIVPVQPTPEQPSVEQPTISAQSTNVQVEKLKEFSNGYFSHFIELLKQPTQALTMKTSFLNSILSFILYLFIISYTIYTMINKVYGSTLGGFSDFGVSESIPFKFMFAIMLVLGIFTFVAIVALFVLAKIFAGHASFSQLFGQVMNFYPVLITISVVAFVLQLIGITGFGILVTIVAIFIALLFIPLYVIVHVLQTNPHKVDTYYIYLMLAGVIAILLYLVLNSMVSQLIEEVMDSLSFF